MLVFDLDLQKLNEFIERPEEYFLTGMIDKRIAWSIYIPLRLAVKRTEYISTLKIPSDIDHRLSGVASALGTLSRAAIGLGFSKGTSGYFTCKNCSLTAGHIIDFPEHSVVAIAFPYSENYVEGKIRAKSKGWVWKNKVLTGVELELYNEGVKRSIENDNVLMGLIMEFFGSQVFWMGIRNFDKIVFSIKDVDGKKYNIIMFELNRLLKKGMNFLTERGIDFRKVPELIFDIAEKIAQKAPPLPKVCPYCGTETHTEYCPSCGKKIK